MHLRSSIAGIQVTSETGIHVHHNESELGPYLPSVRRFTRHQSRSAGVKAAELLKDDGLSFRSISEDGMSLDIEASGDATIVPDALESQVEDDLKFLVGGEEIRFSARSPTANVLSFGEMLGREES